jgi:DNA-binding PadR family transcriptional regulator
MFGRNRKHRLFKSADPFGVGGRGRRHMADMGHGGRGDRRGHGGRRRRMFDSGQLRFVILQLVADTPRHGYDIIKALEERLGGLYTPSAGVIYPTLALLEDQGFVTVAPAESHKKLYTITPEGSAFLEENRAFVDAVNARMAGPGDSHHGHHAPELREGLHVLKVAIRSRLRAGALDAEKIKLIKAILSQAAADVEKL